MIPRLFVEFRLFINDKILLVDNNFHYLINVLRCKIDNDIILINGKDGEFFAKIIGVSNKKCELEVVKKTKEYCKQDFLSLVFAPINKIDILVKSATELGVTDFFPVKTEYTKNVNLNRILPNIIEAVEQCERLDLPEIHKIQTLEYFLNNLDNESSLIFCEERSDNSFKNIKINNKKIYCLVGPEGGFSNKEKELIKQHKNTIPISLGELILRSETATISIISIIKTLL